MGSIVPIPGKSELKRAPDKAASPPLCGGAGPWDLSCLHRVGGPAACAPSLVGGKHFCLSDVWGSVCVFLVPAHQLPGLDGPLHRPQLTSRQGLPDMR